LASSSSAAATHSHHGLAAEILNTATAAPVSMTFWSTFSVASSASR